MGRARQRASQPYKSLGVGGEGKERFGALSLLKRKHWWGSYRNNVLLQRNGRGQRDFFQADRFAVREMVETAEEVTSLCGPWTFSDWSRPGQAGVMGYTGDTLVYTHRQDTRAAWSPSMLVTQSPTPLYYDCNPAIKSYGHSMRSQLTNELERTLHLRIDLNPRAEHWAGLISDSCLPITSDDET